nr:uncharacterized protein LOC109754706 [Aegilops tauschii subsp. strangulata]
MASCAAYFVHPLSRAVHSSPRAATSTYPQSRRWRRRPHHLICFGDPTALPRPIPAPPLLSPSSSSRRRPSRGPFLRRTPPGRLLPLGAHKCSTKRLQGFKQEEHEPLALAWDRMKEATRNCPNHGMEEWLILHMFYNGLDNTSKTMLDTTVGGIIIGKPIEDVKKLLDGTQDNNAQWHVERTTTKRVNAIEESNTELTKR